MNENAAKKSDKYLLLEQINYAESVVNRSLDAPEVTRLVEGMDSYTGGSDEGEYTDTCKLRIIATAAYLAGKQQADKDTTAILEAAKELGRVEVLEQSGALYPAEDWHEDIGDVLWHRLPLQEAPQVGTPMDTEWDTPWPLSPQGFSAATFYTHYQLLPKVNCEFLDAHREVVA